MNIRNVTGQYQTATNHKYDFPRIQYCNIALHRKPLPPVMTRLGKFYSGMHCTENTFAVYQTISYIRNFKNPKLRLLVIKIYCISTKHISQIVNFFVF